MEGILLVVIPFFLYFIAYHTYGKFLAKKIFSLQPETKTPAHLFKDNIDFVPTRKEILFGHHFTSIAGTGPIVGPAIAIIWGWFPALVWVVVGSIFMGAVHDFGALVLSVRNEGKSIGELCGEIINPRVRILFLGIIFFALFVVIAIFGLIIALLFNMFPQTVFPIFCEIPIAMWLGYSIYKKKKNPLPLSLIALILMYLTVIIGSYIPIPLPSIGNISSLTLWVLIIFFYAYIASVLPVWKLLQPRDYINSHQLLVALLLLLVGVLVSTPPIVAPMINLHPKGAPSIFPFLFVIVACGAISGFHSLVSSGTTAKQLNNEKDSLFVGYGSMLFEGFLAVLVISAVACGIGMYMEVNGKVLQGITAWKYYYSSWQSMMGLGKKVGAFVIGGANLLQSVGIPREIGVTIIGVLIVSFAGTTIDTATRLERYVVMEIAGNLKINLLKKRHPATGVSILSALALAMSQGGGKGGLLIWPLFGALNQMIAGLCLLAVNLYLKMKKKNIACVLVPLVFIIIITIWAMVSNLRNFAQKREIHLIIIGTIVFLLNLWILFEGFLLLKKKKITTQ